MVSKESSCAMPIQVVIERCCSLLGRRKKEQANCAPAMLPMAKAPAMSHRGLSFSGSIIFKQLFPELPLLLDGSIYSSFHILQD